MGADDEWEEFDPEKVAVFEKMMGVSGVHCEQLGLGKDFVLRSIECNDREFVTRMHPLLDSSISVILSKYCFVQKFLSVEFSAGVSEFCNSMSFDGKLGKLRLIELYGLASKRTIKFLSHLNRIRNRYVHNIEYFNCDIEEIISRDRLGDEFKRYLLSRDLSSEFRPESAAQFRLVMGLSVAAAMWEIDHFAKSGLSLLASRRVGDPS